MAENVFATCSSKPTQLTLNINDALDLMQDDNTFMNPDMSVYGSGRSDVYSVTSLPQNEILNDAKKKAFVQIIEEPQPKALRFRYICEGRSAGSIPGVNSTAENKTYPTIKVVGYKGPAMVVVSCVTIDTPYRPHPHNLVGKDGCRKGICSMRINNDSMECSFPNLGIQCIKRKDVEEALRIREEQRIDPFHTGFAHRDQPQNIDLNAVRLCFQIFLKDDEKGKFSIPLQPVVSNAIYDKKATSDLIICKLSDCSSCVVGGKDIILLCDKVNKDDIQIRFYELRGDRICWQAFGDFQASDVHKQVAISFKTPKYDNLEIESSVRVYIQLVRPSDQSKSEPRPFDYLPLESDPHYVKRKLAKLGNSSNREHISKFLDVFPEANVTNVLPRDILSSHRRQVRTALRPSRITDKVKLEPQDTYNLAPSPDLVGTTTVLQKSPVMAHHTSGGGIVYQIPTQQTVAPFILPHSPIYFAESAPVATYTVEPLSQMNHLSSSYDRSNVSNFAEAHTGIYDRPTAYTINPLIPAMKLSSVDADRNRDNDEEMDEQKKMTEPSIDSDLIRQINSAELIPFDSTLLNNFSSSLTFSDSIGPPNQLDSKTVEQMSVDSRPATFQPNIPLTSANNYLKQEEAIVTATSDSLKNLVNDLEFLNNLTKDGNQS